MVSADIFRPGVDTIDDLRETAPNDIWDGSLIHVRDTNTIYAYDLESVDSDDGLDVIEPATGTGRWLRVGFGGAGTGSTADKWVDVTKITSTESVVVDKTAEDDWPQEVVREEITVDGSLTITDGYVIIGPQNLAETLEVYNQTQGYNIQFTAGDNLIMPQNAPPTTGAGEGSFFVGDGTGTTIAGQPYFREESDGAIHKLNNAAGGESLAGTLAIGNTTGGTDMSFTAGDNLFLPENAPPTTPAGFGSFFVGDGTSGTTQGKPYFREPSDGTVSQLGTAGGGEDLAATLALGNTTGGTDISLTAGDHLFLPENAPPTTPASVGSFFVADGTGGTTAGYPYFREASSGSLILIAKALDVERINMPESPGNTVHFYGWVPRSCRLIEIKAFMTTLNTVGNLNFYASSGGNNLLSGTSYNLNGLSAINTVNNIPLTGTSAHLQFAVDQVWKIAVESTDPGMDGEGIYIQLVWEAGP